MATTLIKNAAHLVTFEDNEGDYEGGGVFIRDNVIEKVGSTSALPAHADVEIDASGTIVLPGMVNTHHHFFQTLTRNVPGTQDAGLFEWLVKLYPMWARLTPEAMAVATMTAMAELMLTGCTTTSDHTYVWPGGARVDDQIDVALKMGMRFHAARGSMSVGQSQGGLPPDDVVENEDAILADCERVISQHHDPAPYSMTRIVLAPCSPFSVSPDLMRQSIALARKYRLHSHTHLAETADEERYCLERFGMRPVEYAESLGWSGPDVWHAHAVCTDAAEVQRLGTSRTGVAHCPTSNMRLASGVAPVPAMLAAGVRVGLGVDGSASNDASSMLDEARQAMLLQRVSTRNPAALTARQTLAMATRGGAAVLGRDDIGTIAPGKAADIIGYKLDTLGLSGGAVHDPLASLLFCRPGNVDFSVINGRVRIRNGEFTDVDLPRLIDRHNRISRSLQSG